MAALFVIIYHLGEGFATSPFDQSFNHGYLAVDFFFVLSGFVLGYAYDGRWKKGLSEGGFLLRRIIRLQPMVVAGVLLGVASYLIQGCEKWDGTHVGGSAVVISFLLALFMLPVMPGWNADVRGNGEMFPLNGPSWSLFFEYIGSLFYALFLHRMSVRALTWFTAAAGIVLATISIGNYSGFHHLGVGWTAADGGFWLGLARMTFSFSAGLLMSRVFKPVKIRGAFWLCSLILFAIMAVPYVGGEAHSVYNGVYDAVCTLFVFPLVVYLGASGRTTDPKSEATCEFMGRISYPLYVVHYPFMYLFYAWVWRNGYDFSRAWPVAVAIVPTVVAVAWLFMKFYDTPVRRRLRKLFKI